MSRVWSVLVVMVACLLAVNVVSAQDKKDKKRGERPSPEQRWAAIAKAADKEGATVLTKDEFIKGFKASAHGQMADRAEGMYKHIKKASEDKVTKDEYIAAVKEFIEKMKKGDHKRGEHKEKK